MSSDEELTEVKRVVGGGSQRTALEGMDMKQSLAPRGPGGAAQSSEDLGDISGGSLQLVEKVLGGAVNKDSSVGLLVAVAQRLEELGVGSAANLLSLAEKKGAETETGVENQGVEIKEDTKPAASAVEDKTKDSQATLTGRATSAAKYGRSEKTLNPKQMLARIVKQVIAAVATSNEPWVKKGGSDPCPAGDVAECTSSQCKCTPKDGRNGGHVIKVPPTWSSAELGNNVWTCDVYRKNICGKGQPDCDVSKHIRNNAIMKIKKRPYETVFNTRLVFARPFPSYRAAPMMTGVPTAHPFVNPENFKTAQTCAETKGDDKKKGPDNTFLMDSYPDDQWWHTCPVRHKIIPVQSMNKVFRTASVLKPLSLVTYFNAMKKLSPYLQKMDIMPGGGRSTSCMAAINMDATTRKCDHPKPGKIPHCGFVSAKCQTFDVFYDADSGEAALPQSNAEGFRNMAVLRAGCNKKGGPLKSAIIRYAFTMWKHTTCFLMTPKGGGRPITECKSRKTCTCARVYVGGGRRAQAALLTSLGHKIPKMAQTLDSEGMLGDSADTATTGKSAQRKGKKSVMQRVKKTVKKGVKRGRKMVKKVIKKLPGRNLIKKLPGKKATGSKCERSKEPKECNNPKDCTNTDVFYDRGFHEGIGPAMCAFVPPAVETIQRAQCTMW